MIPFSPLCLALPSALGLPPAPWLILLASMGVGQLKRKGVRLSTAPLPVPCSVRLCPPFPP